VYQAGAARGTQVSTGSLLYDKPQKMRKIDADLSVPFENQARKKDQTSDSRSVSCALRARSSSRALTVKGRLRLRLEGSAGGRVWESRNADAPIDKGGEASFSADLIRELVDEAAGVGAKIERFRVAFDGASGKKVARLDFDCWQLVPDA
jgi:hypothetical protein